MYMCSGPIIRQKELGANIQSQISELPYPKATSTREPPSPQNGALSNIHFIADYWQ